MTYPDPSIGTGLASLPLNASAIWVSVAEQTLTSLLGSAADLLHIFCPVTYIEA